MLFDFTLCPNKQISDKFKSLNIDNSMVITRGKLVVGGGESKGGINGDGRRLDLGW